ncbi:NADH-quinone oxidoreductase subunit J [bacterium]|nr:NADH-quinone oxidoreductase subunit J [bacterium]
MSSTEILISIIFYLSAFLIVFGALAAIFAKRIVHSLILAVIVFFTVGILFLILNAEYNAIIQFAVYGVAIPILLVFAIMFTSYKNEKNVYLAFDSRFVLAFISLVLFVLTVFNILLISSSVIDWLFTPQSALNINRYEMFNAISNGLYIKFFFSFELIALFIFIVIVGLSTLNLFREKRNG